MPKVAMVQPSHVKETMGEELLYSPLALGYLARHTPRHHRVTLHDEYVGEDFDPDRVDADIVAVSAITPGITRAYAFGDRLRKRGIQVDDRTVRVVVKDDGVGMTADQVRGAFDPFYTTRAPGEGMGLGLPICQAIAIANGGSLTVTSAPGQGSTFRLELPTPALG